MFRHEELLEKIMNLPEPNFVGLSMAIKQYVESLSTKPITYKIYHSPDINVNGTATLFDDIIEFE
mgnify:CR=1 FL=1